ncbi:MAG: hypothetical protein U0L97_01635 [Candidatus Saccharimonadaceae bacterium]|nr:hypothetical protein [Candidatus Saccharimonadaceae bacterium]
MNNENFNIAPNDENEEFTVEFGEVINDGGTHDYNELDNQPQINGHTLEGNKTNEQLGLQDKINDLDTIRSGATKGATAVQPEDLARIATTGSYNDSLEKPSVNNVALIGNISLDALGIQPKGDYALESEIPDVSNFITKDVNNLVNYTLKTNTGSLIDLEINQTTYVVTLSLKDQDGNVISTDTIDLPLENVVVSGSYDSTNQKIVLTLQSGDTVDIPVGALVSGLQSEITSQNKLASDLIDDSNSGNKFVTTSEKQTWNNKLDSEDLTDYVKNTDYATAEKGGTIRTSNASGLGISNGNLYAVTKAYNTYNSASGNMFIGKGTLENVITGKNLETSNNKVTSVSSSSTNTEYPSAKAVYDYIQSLNGDEVNY